MSSNVALQPHYRDLARLTSWFLLKAGIQHSPKYSCFARMAAISLISVCVGKIKKTKRSGVLFRALTRALGAYIETEFCIGIRTRLWQNPWFFFWIFVCAVSIADFQNPARSRLITSQHTFPPLFWKTFTVGYPAKRKTSRQILKYVDQKWIHLIIHICAGQFDHGHFG